MKALKITIIVLAAIIALAYLAFLFVIPNAINLNHYTNDIKRAAFENAKLNVDLSNIKIITTPNLKAGLRIDDLKVSYPDNTQLLNTQKAEVKINLLPLIFKTVQISDVTVNNPQFNIEVYDNGRLKIEKYFADNMQNTAANQEPVAIPFKISDKMPKVMIQGGEVSFTDLKTKNNIKLMNDKILIDKTILNKHARIALTGKVVANDKENMVYDLNIDTFLPDMTNQEVKKEAEAIYFDFVDEFIKYDFKANIKSDLKITQKKDNLRINGKFDADNISFVIDKKTLPQSNIHAVFKNEKISFDALLALCDNEKAAIKGVINNSKHPDIALNVLTEKISINNLQKIAIAVFSSLNIPNDLNKIQTKGYITSDFDLKTNLKKFESKGKFEVVNGEIRYNLLGLNVTAINSLVDMSGNEFKINKTTALINGTPFNITGKITSDAVADISVTTKNLKIAQLANTLMPADLRKSYEVQSGILDLSIVIKGKLEDIKPAVNMQLANLKAKDKLNNITFINKSLNADIKTNGKDFSGDIALNDSKAILNDLNMTAVLPAVAVSITPKVITVKPSTLSLNNSNLAFEGIIKEYSTKPDINLSAKGKINSLDIKAFVDKSLYPYVTAKGSLPLLVKISGNDKKINVKAQIMADAQNHFTVATIKKLAQKDSILNIDTLIEGSNINITDAGLYMAAEILGNDFASLKTANEVIKLNGHINGNKLKGIKLTIPQELSITNDALPKSNVNLKANINIDGNMASPALRGNINLSSVSIPDYLIRAQIININLNSSSITGEILGLNVNGNPMDIDFSASSKITMPFVVHNMKLVSSDIDLDKIIYATTKFPQAPAGTVVSNAPMIPVTILNGSAKIAKFKTGTIEASNITSDFKLHNDLLTISPMKANAFDGNVSGMIKYNLKNLHMTADLNGSDMNANKAVTALIAIKDQLQGTLDFTAKIAMSGDTMEKQLKTMSGNASFKVKDGQMGSLGRLDFYLKAGNILNNSFLKSNIYSVVNTVAPYNTGKFAVMEGALSFNNGYVHLKPVTSSGEYMALLLDGKLNMLNSNGDIKIYGRLNQKLTSLLGPLADMSLDKILNYIPKFGSVLSGMLKAFNAVAPDNTINNIPQLTPKASSKTFKVVIDGNTMNPSSVKSFQWLNTEEAQEKTEESLSSQLQIKIPKTKEEIIEQVKEIPQIKQLQENETVKTLQNFGKLFLKPKEE